MSDRVPWGRHPERSYIHQWLLQKRSLGANRRKVNVFSCMMVFKGLDARCSLCGFVSAAPSKCKRRTFLLPTTPMDTIQMR